MNESEAIDLALTPHLITDPLTCNEVIGFLNGIITDMAMAEWEAELAANIYQHKLLISEGKTNAVALVEWKISELYKKWRLLKLELQKFRAYRQSLRKKEETLMGSTKYIRNNYANYPRAI